MSEEVENKGGFFSNLKNQVITGAGVTLTTLGTIFIDEVKSLVGIEDEPTEQVVPAQSNQQSVNVSGPEIVINIPEQKTETKTIIVKDTTARKPVKKKEMEEELDW